MNKLPKHFAQHRYATAYFEICLISMRGVRRAVVIELKQSVCIYVLVVENVSVRKPLSSPSWPMCDDYFL